MYKAIQIIKNRVTTILPIRVNTPIKAARCAIKQRYGDAIPEQIVWDKDLESENEGLKPYKTKAWLVQRLYLAQLGVYAAEKIANTRKQLIWVTFIIAAISYVAAYYILPVFFEYFKTAYTVVLFSSAILALGIFPVSYRIFLPRYLIENDDMSAIESLVSRCILRVFPKETPPDLRDCYRNLVIDAEGDSVAGQILSADLEIPFFADQLKRTRFSWLIMGAILWCSIFYGWFISLCLLAAWWIIEYLGDGPLRARSVLSAEASSECASEYLTDTASREYFRQQEFAKTEQIANAIRDKSPFMDLGSTTGLLYERRDPLAPSEAGLPFGLSINDLSTHMLVLGATGTGKTSGVIRPLLRQWIDNHAGGLLVLDGKGELPTEVSDLNPDYVLISPESDAYNPIENLEPDEVAESFAAVFVGNAADPFWEDSAILLIRFAAVLLKYSGEHYTIHNLYRLCTSSAFQIQIAKTVPNDLQGVRLMAIEYFAKELPSMPEKTRGSIIGMVRTWMLSLIGNEKLANWISFPHGAQIEDVMHGKQMGLSLPESRYGKGGVLISILSLRRLYTAIKNRGNNWQAQDQKAVLLVVDEFQNLATRNDLDILPIARSLGLYCCFATQNVDGLERELGKADAEQLIGNLSNMIALPCRTKNSDVAVSKRIGKIWRSLPDTHASVADSYADLGRYVFNGGDKWSMATSKQRAQRPNSSRVARSTTQDAMHIVRQWSSSILSLIGFGRGNSDPKSLSEFDSNRINTVKIGTTDLISPDEINSLLSCPNTAIAQIIRGRVPRRDVIKLKPEYRSN